MNYKTIPLIVSMILGGTALAGHAQCQNGGACPDAFSLGILVRYTVLSQQL